MSTPPAAATMVVTAGALTALLAFAVPAAAHIEVTGRVLIVRPDIPKNPRTLPRFAPDHELAR